MILEKGKGFTSSDAHIAYIACFRLSFNINFSDSIKCQSMNPSHFIEYSLHIRLELRALNVR